MKGTEDSVTFSRFESKNLCWAEGGSQFLKSFSIEPRKR
jgi:hypothetical protein